jgi:DNA-binding NarL/FixJ family response regulator
MRVLRLPARIVTMAFSVVIVDDHAGFRRSARALLEADGFDVVGEAADGSEAGIAVDRLRPAVVLLDIQLPDEDGFELAERLIGVPNPPMIVLISSRDAASYGDRLTRSRARGFIAKRDLSGAALSALIG